MMNNYNLQTIREINNQIFLETSFYQLPVFASEKSIINELESCLNKNAEKILKSAEIELYWVDEEINITVLNRLLSNDENVLFLPKQYRKQVVNAQKRQQPCYFFIEKGIYQNLRGSWELRLRQSCEAEAHKKGYKYGFNLSIVLGTSVHEITVDGNLNILDIHQHNNKLLANTVFEEIT